MRNTKNMTKKLAVVSIVLLLATVASFAVVITSWMKESNINADVDEATFTWYDTTQYVDMEEYTTTFDFSDVGALDELYLTGYKMKASADIDNSITAKYVFTSTGGNTTEGLELYLEYNNSGTWTSICNMINVTATDGTHQFSSSDEIELRFHLIVDEYIAKGDYQYQLDIIKEA